MGLVSSEPQKTTKDEAKWRKCPTFLWVTEWMKQLRILLHCLQEPCVCKSSEIFIGATNEVWTIFMTSKEYCLPSPYSRTEILKWRWHLVPHLWQILGVAILAFYLNKDMKKQTDPHIVSYLQKEKTNQHPFKAAIFNLLKLMAPIN